MINMKSAWVESRTKSYTKATNKNIQVVPYIPQDRDT